MEGEYWCHRCLRAVQCTDNALCLNCGFGGVERRTRPVIELPEAMRGMAPEQLSDRLRMLFDMLNDVYVAENEEGMSDDEIDVISTAPALEEDCSVCLQIHSEDVVRELPCGHTFHDLCLRNWLKVKATCPICKRSAREEVEF